LINEQTATVYEVIRNCPKCRGALVIRKSIASGKETFQCFQCGAEFKEYKKPGQARKEKDNSGDNVIYAKPLHRFKAVQGADDWENKEEQSSFKPDISELLSVFGKKGPE